MPNLFVIAGPNGAGKSTSAPEILSGVRNVAEFVNADFIQREAGVSEIEAGRITLERLNRLAEAGKDMAFETTLASQLLFSRIRRMQARGYAFHLFFFWLQFFRHYLPVADSWILFDNTSPFARRIAWRDVGARVQVGDNALWLQLSTRYMKPRAEEEKAAPLPEKRWTSEDVLEAVNRAVERAIARHRARGEPIVVWRDGKIVWLQPGEY